MTDYEKQADDFLKETGTKLTAVYTGHRPHFEGEKEFRATYMITLARGIQSAKGATAMSFTFGQSMAGSYKFTYTPIHRSMAKKVPGFMLEGVNLIDAFRKVVESGTAGTSAHGEYTTVRSHKYGRVDVRIQKNMVPPSSYDVLACLTAYDPETFADFCGAYGYDEDSRKAETIYQAVRKEYQDLARMFNSEELEALSEIS